jgi:hypothetical protein
MKIPRSGIALIAVLLLGFVGRVADAESLSTGSSPSKVGYDKAAGWIRDHMTA